jgi:hypothetical protein
MGVVILYLGACVVIVFFLSFFCSTFYISFFDHLVWFFSTITGIFAIDFFIKVTATSFLLKYLIK